MESADWASWPHLGPGSSVVEQPGHLMTKHLMTNSDHKLGNQFRYHLTDPAFSSSPQLSY
jgi:hypothetical protein